MSGRPKSLILLLCALLLGGGAPRPVPATETLPAAYVDSLSHELQQYGHDEWSSSQVHLTLLLRQFHKERRRAPSFEAAAYQARAATELRSDHPEDAYFDAHRATVLHKSIGYTRAYAGDLLTAAQAEYRLGGYQPALDNIAHAQSLLHDRSDARDVNALAAFMTGQIDLAAGDTVGAQRSFTQAASLTHGVLYETARAYVDLARGTYETSRAAYELVPWRAQNTARALLERADAEFAKAAQSAPKEAPQPAAGNPCRSNAQPRICADVYFVQDVARQGWDDPKWLLANELLGRAQAMAAIGDAAHAKVEIELARRESEKAGQSDSRLDAAINSLQTLINAREDRALFRGDPGFFLDDISPREWQAYYDFARMFQAIDLRDKALSTYNTATQSIEFLRAGLSPERREPFLDGHVSVYDDYIELLLARPGDDRRAFDVLQQRTARQTIDAMRDKQLQQILRGASPDARRAAQLGARAQAGAWRIAMLQDAFSGTQSRTDLAVLQREQETVVRRFASLRERLRTSHNRADRQYYAWSSEESAQPLRSAHDIVTKVLRPHETMLVYAWLPHEIAVWTLSYNHYGGVRIVPRTAQLARDLGDAFVSDIDTVRGEELSPQAAAARIADFQEHSAAVYRALVAGSPIPARDDLIVVPSGPLYQVAFEALVTDANTRGCPGSYLICTHAVSYAASPETLAVARERLASVAPRSLLAFARPAIRKSNGATRSLHVAMRGCSGQSTLATLDDLTETQNEALQSATAFAGAPSRVNLGEAASYRSLMALNGGGELARYRYVLFATHALLPGENCAVTEPSIVFSHPDVPAAHGLLTVSDVSQLQLGAQVVLLSACSTGAYLSADDRPLGDGISEMTRAFLFAGSRSVGVTLWDVYDKAGPQLVPPFFHAIGKDGLSPAHALQRAKIAMINSDMRHPFFWAPTVLYGDAQ